MINLIKKLQKNNIKTEKEFVSWIREQIDFYSPILGLQIQRIEIEKGEDTKFMEITCTYPYLEPIIRYSHHSFEKWQKGKFPKDRILHELCHILTDPLYVKAIERYVGKGDILDERERLTDTIAVIIRNLLEK